jgi:hypothetical protein
LAKLDANADAPIVYGYFLGVVGGILNDFLSVPRPLFRFAFGLFLQTLRLLFLASNQLPGLLLRFAGEVFESALDLVFVHYCFSLKEFERITLNSSHLMTRG